MSQVVLDQILEQVTTLQTNEIYELMKNLQERLNTETIDHRRQQLNQALLATGLIKTLRIRHLSPSERLPLIDVPDEPVSETIIKERR